MGRGLAVTFVSRTGYVKFWYPKIRRMTEATNTTNTKA